MKDKTPVIPIYSFIAALAFGFAIGFFVYNIFIEARTGDSRANTAFISFSQNIEANIGDAVFIESLTRTEDCASLSITKNDAVIFAYPQVAAAARPSKYVKIYNSVFTKTNGANPFTSTTDNYAVAVGIYTIRPAVIFRNAKTSFIIILIVTIITAILLIYYNLVKNDGDDYTMQVVPLRMDDVQDVGEEQVASDVDGGGQTVQVPVSEPLPADMQVPPFQPQQFTQATGQAATSATADAVQTDQQVLQAKKVGADKSSDAAGLDALQKDAAHSKVAQNNEENDMDNEANEKTENAQVKELQQMYSASTGVLLEARLAERLDNEIVRASSEEQDLALFMIMVEGMERNSEYEQAVVNYLLSEVQFRDKIFEHNNDGFTIIKTEMSAQDSEPYAQKMLSDIINIAKDGGVDEKYQKCFIGVSTRAGRMIDANRLITETSEALHRASTEETSKIVTFHVDIDKYREYVAKN